MIHSPTRPLNGHAFGVAQRQPALTNLLAEVQLGDNSDRTIFALFAELAERAGRSDLQAEFRQRAEVATPPPVAPTPSPTPTNPEAVGHADRGLAGLRDGRLPEAEAALREAIRIDPRYTVAHTNLGVAFARQKKFAEAEAAFHLVVRLDPTGSAGYANLGSACLDRGKVGEAEVWFRQAVHLDPQSAGAHRLLGTALEATNQREPAEAAYRESMRLDPRHADTRRRLGSLLAITNRREEAETLLREAVRLDPTNAPGWHRLALLLEQQERFADAEPCAREAVRLEPEAADGQNLLGVVLAGLERHDEAAPYYREAIRLKPDFVIALSNLGNTLRIIGELDEAEKSLREAFRLQPTSPEVRNNLGIVLVQGGNIEEGLTHYDEALRMRPEYAEAHLNRSLALLAKGDYANGWAPYEWRLKLRGGKGPQYDAPRWDGQPLDGKTVLLRAEQGLGDTVNFIRYAALVRERCGRVVVESQEPVAKLVATCPGVDEVLVNPSSQPSAAAWAPLVSLPALFGVPPNGQPSPVPYLHPPAERVAFWKQELANVQGLKVGIAWQGSKVHKGDRLRSVTLKHFLPLARIPGVRLISLQKYAGVEQLAGVPADEVLDLGSRIEAGLEDAAALIENLDLLVIIDTALAHVAGAIGRPVWVGVYFAADWRWLREGEHTVWYPSMRLFRQQKSGEWGGVFERFAEALTEAARAKTEGRWGDAPVGAVVGT